jgi:hypothetical protein
LKYLSEKTSENEYYYPKQKYPYTDQNNIRMNKNARHHHYDTNDDNTQIKPSHNSLPLVQLYPQRTANGRHEQIEQREALHCN